MTDICLTFFLTKFKRLFQSASHSVMSNYCSVHGILQDRTLEWAAFLFSRGLPNPGIEPRSPTSQADSLPADSPGKPKNTGVGGLSLPQQMFLTQESNRGLLHCRWILHQLSYQGTTSAIHFMSPAGEHLCFSHACLHYTAHECITIRIN